MEDRKIYAVIALELVKRVVKINPAAKVVANYNLDPNIVTQLIESWHKNTGISFLQEPFNYLSPENFK